MEQSRISALEGNDISDYERVEIPEGRWKQTWEVFKTNFSKIIFINVLILLFLVPAAVVLILKSGYISSFGVLYPFNSNFGTGYPAYPSTVGLEESIKLSSDLMFYSLLIVMGFIASVGISGGAYSIKKLINTKGEFTFKGFFHGVKVCYFNTIIPVTIFLAFLFAAVIVGDWANFIIATGNNPVWPTIAKVCSIILLVVVGIICLWMVAVGASYKVSIWQTIKNSVVLLIATPIQSIFFVAFALIPVWLMLLFNYGSFWFILVLIFVLICGLSFVFIVWMSYTQWVFDMFITPNLKVKTADGKVKSAKEIEEEKAEQEKQVAMQLLAAGKSELIGKPILPIEDEILSSVPKVFRRADVHAVKAEKLALDERILAYSDEHKNDEQYAEYNKMFAEREKPVEDNGKKKKKKINSDNLLR